MSKKIKLNVLGLSYSQTQSGAYALVLSEEGGKRIPIIIGSIEAQSIAIKLEGLETPRPLTHDLFCNFSNVFGVEIEEVIIYKLEEGIFYSELICVKDGKKVNIDSRTSDAVALALRFNCPIYTYESIIEQAGIVLDNKYEEEDSESEPIAEHDDVEAFDVKSLNDLEQLLKDAINREDYEKASDISDEIKKRKK